MTYYSYVKYAKFSTCTQSLHDKKTDENWWGSAKSHNFIQGMLVVRMLFLPPLLSLCSGKNRSILNVMLSHVLISSCAFDTCNMISFVIPQIRPYSLRVKLWFIVAIICMIFFRGDLPGLTVKHELEKNIIVSFQLTLR